MTLVDTITSLSERFLRDRTFELIVAPAIADLQFDDSRGDGLRHVRSRVAVVVAFAWGLYEDFTSEPPLTFAALTLLPAAYYTALVIFFLRDLRLMSSGVSQLVVACAIGVLSLGPAIACYWPERPPRRLPTETP